MSENPYLFTSQRAGFRKWTEDDDCEDFFKMNTNPDVMEHFPGTLTRAESDAFYDRIQMHFETHGFGLFAVDNLSTKKFIGFTGFQYTTFEADFTPCFEIGWRLIPSEWNKGLATEAGLRCLEYAFNHLELTRIYSFTSHLNKRAQRVIQKIGLSQIGVFEHPKLKSGDPLRKHLLYLIEKENF